MRLLPVFAPGEGVLAAVSGGADSVALLLLLKEQRDAGRIRLFAAHLNHMIRGERADRDESFVRKLCARLCVNLTVERVDVPAQAAGRGLETCARRLRRDFLTRTAHHLGLSAVATAHHADDQAETVLMHLLRGGGVRGAAGMRARGGLFVKPLLACTKAEILTFLAAHDQPYCEDETNFMDDTPRNALRLHVLPALTTLYPGASRALGRYAQIAADEDDFVAEQAALFLRANARVLPFGARLARAQAPVAVVRRALLLLSGGADFETCERLMDLFERERGALERGEIRFERTGEALYRIDRAARPPRQEIPAADGARLNALGMLRVRPSPPTPVRDDRLCQVVDAQALEGAVLRVRRTGDIMRPLGAPGAKKLSDVMIDKKLDRPLRDWTALLARDNRILWIPGIGLSQEASVSKYTKATLRLEWKREDVRAWETE